jgi:hypothetical protein
MKIHKLLLAAVGATVLFGSLVSAAYAGRFEVSNKFFRATFREVEFHMAFSTTRCELILEGVLHSRTMPKVIGSLIGFITRATLGACVNGTAIIQEERLPWHVRYSGFQGILPEINSVITHIIGVGVRIRESLGFVCLILSSAAEPVSGTYHRNVITHHLTVGLGGTIRPSECPNVSIVSDSPQVVISNTAIALSLSLI